MVEKEPTPVYRELKPIRLWSSVMHVNMLDQVLRNELANIAVELQQNICGFIERNPANSDEAISFTRTRYPRRKYGLTSIPDCRHGMEYMGEILGAQIEEQAIKENVFRVLLGLNEGYGPNAKLHTVDDVRTILGEDFFVVPANMVRILPKEMSGISPYSEAAAVIYGNVSNLNAVYELGNAMQQERFAVEDFSQAKAYIVETPHCRGSDRR